MMINLHTCPLSVSPGVNELIRQGYDILPFLSRHRSKDWGNLSDEEKAFNDYVMGKQHGTLWSVYTISSGADIWVLTNLTNAVRTTVMLPHEH
ncbi:TPA: hypothetical protein ACIVB1_004946 [Salmonella enterica subsp. diarizonae serovar 61:l,v:z35]